MTPSTERLVSYACAICGSEQRHVVLKKSGAAIIHRFDIVKCRKCGHIYVDPRVANDLLRDLYDEAYYKGHGFDRTIDYAGPPSPSKIAEIDAIEATVTAARPDGVAGARWLDFGCGAGFLLERLVERNVDALGFDDAEPALRRCAQKGLPVSARHGVEVQRGTFDVVSAVEVIEHVPDPRGFLRYLTSFLRIGGLLYVQTGNWNMVRRLPGTPYLMPEGHIHYFTPPVMRRLFKDVGLVEAETFSHSWIVWRYAPAALRARIPPGAFAACAAIAKSLAPGYAAFPVGIRNQ